jgi:zinc-binding alcohol dehydrogenase family protein
MRAVGYRNPLPITDPEALIDIDLPDPTPSRRDLLVRVKAVSVNPVDVKVRAKVAPPQGDVRLLGFDAAGVVEAVGSDTSLFKPGDEVYYSGSIARQGTDAELHVVDERIVGRKPASLTFPQAAAMPLTTITAWELLFHRLGVSLGDKSAKGTLLVINGAGGVGSILIQLARQLTGLTVIATASRPESRAWASDMGAHLVIDHQRPLNEALVDAGFASVDLVASLTATEHHWPAIAEAIAPEGRIAVIDDPKQLDIVPFKRKSVSIHWEFMFTRPLFETNDMIEQHNLLNKAAHLFDDGVLRHTMKEDFGPINAANLRRAHAHQESGKAIGKSVLTGF